jgi:hypothetical protein
MQRMQRCNEELSSMSPDTPALSPLSAADLLARGVAARDLDKHRCTPLKWLCHGYLGPGKVTLLTSQWKAGKTTLLSLLLARLHQGGQLAGLSVAPARAFVISEESEADWRPRFAHLGIRDNVDLLCRPFTARPSMDEWLALIDTALAMHHRQGSDLVVIDSLGYFLPAHSENSASALLECLTPLHRLSTAGMSMCLPHHPARAKRSRARPPAAAAPCPASSTSSSRWLITPSRTTWTGVAAWWPFRDTTRRRGIC